jgi:hypothetical protein
MARPTKEYAAFRDLTDKLLTVSKTELDRRVAHQKAEAAKNPHKRGPKPKVRPSLSDPDADPGEDGSR